MGSSPPLPSSGLHPHSLSCNPLLSLGYWLPDTALPTLIAVTRKGCVPWDGGWGSSIPRAWAQPSGSAAWSLSRLPCRITVSPLQCEPQEGRAGLSWSLPCPVAQSRCLATVIPIAWSWGGGVGRARR